MKKPLLLADLLAFIAQNPATETYTLYALGVSPAQKASKKLLYWQDQFVVMCDWNEDPLYTGTDAGVAITTFNNA